MYTSFKYNAEQKQLIETLFNDDNVIIKVIVNNVVVFESDIEENKLDILTNSRYKKKQIVENKIRSKVSFKGDGVAEFIISELLTQCMSNLIVAQNKSDIKSHCEIVRCLLGILDQAQTLELLKPSTVKEEKQLGNVLKLLKEQKNRKVNN